MTNWPEYKEKLPGYLRDDLSLIEQAFDFAYQIHKNEKRLTGEPFIIHPIAVSLKIAEAKLDTQSVITALLHDTVENTEEDRKAILKKIKKQFGEEIAFLVKGLTKVQKAKYYGVERSAESTRQMFMAMAKDIRVIIIKLFDRLDNLETLYAHPAEKQKQIAVETLEIFAPVADRLGMGGIKSQIENMAFKYAYPDECAWILKEVKIKIPKLETYLTKKVIPKLKKELKEGNAEFLKIEYRAKSYFSLWKKLLRNSMDWETIYDLAAVRVMTGSVEECYKVLGLIHKMWVPLPGKIKDYIALPKQNGYQSLHTTVFCVDKKITEFQIRTQKMHEEAEQGIAAHWAWDMAGKPAQIAKMPHQKFIWINQLKDWHDKFHKNIKGENFLKSLKIDFFKDRVFILTPRGDIIDLPEGATPVDFAYHIHSEIGNSIIGCKVNHKIVPLSYQLASGDMVEIMTQKSRKLSSKILDYAKTSLAKGHIKSALKIKDTKKPSAQADLKLITIDRVGIIKEVGQIFSLFRINIGKLVSKPVNSKYASIDINFHPKNKEQLDRLTTKLKNIKGVKEIEVKYTK